MKNFTIGNCLKAFALLSLTILCGILDFGQGTNVTYAVLGFAPALLKSIPLVTKDNTPQYKLEAAGFLNLLKAQGSADIVSNGTPNGHLRTVNIRSKQRFTTDFVDTTASCDQVNVPARVESNVTLDLYHQMALYFDNSTIRQYEDEASSVIAVNGSASGMMNEMYDSIRSAANAILQKLDQDLLTKFVSTLGVHRATGNANTVAVNFALNTTNLPLNDGMSKLKHDFRDNGGVGRPQVIGSGLFENFINMQPAKGNDQSGLDTRIQAAGIDWFYDLNAASIFGANQIAVIQPNAVQLVEFIENKGKAFTGKLGNSEFFTIMLPMMVGDLITQVEFDVQMRFIDCPLEVTDAYYGTPITANRGWQVIISKRSGLWTIPLNAYRATDPLFGNRGSLRYTITNS